MLNDIIKTFKLNKNEDNALQMKSYMKDHFEFFGIKSPLRKELSKPFFKSAKKLSKQEIIILIKALWGEPQRELHYFAQELALRQLKSSKKEIKWEDNDIDFLEWLALQHSWWDSIDFIAPNLMGDYFKSFPGQIEPYTQKWIKSENTWLVRCAILFQLKYKDTTNLELLYKIILDTCHTNEFFINKAIGWVLRENSKRIPNEIRAFVDFHSDKLSNLSKKEALRLIT